VLARVIQTLGDGSSDDFGIDGQAANSRIEKIGLFLCQGADDVLDRNVVLSRRRDSPKAFSSTRCPLSPNLSL